MPPPPPPPSPQQLQLLQQQQAQSLQLARGGGAAGGKGGGGGGGRLLLSDDAAAAVRARNELSRLYLTFLQGVVGGGMTASVLLAETPLPTSAAAIAARGGLAGPNAARLLDTILPSVCSILSTAGEAPIARVALALASALVRALLPIAPTPAAPASPAATTVTTIGGGVGAVHGTAPPQLMASVEPPPSPLPPHLRQPALLFLTGPLLTSSLSFVVTSPAFEAQGGAPFGADAQALAAALEAVGLHATLAVHVAAVTGGPPPSKPPVAAPPLHTVAGGGGDLISHLTGVLLPSLGCPVAVAAAYGDRLRLCVGSGNHKDARAAFVAVAKALRAAAAPAVTAAVQ